MNTLNIIITGSCLKTQYASRNIIAVIDIINVSIEMSFVDFVFITFTTGGINGMAFKIPATIHTNNVIFSFINFFRSGNYCNHYMISVK
ncbi:MAG: hypothetical protein PHF46_02270 [Candidatus Gracilibacteria bacterium]|nr:hypothetical protein [Candidatus Gracilibacteria bacterium]